MKICYASRVISSRFVRPAHHSERIFQSPRFIQTGLSILRFQKGVVSPPQPPWRLLEAAKCSHVGGLTNPNTYLLVYLIYDYILIGWKFSFPQPPWRPLETAIHKLIKNCAIKKKIHENKNLPSENFFAHCGPWHHVYHLFHVHHVVHVHQIQDNIFIMIGPRPSFLRHT